MIDVVFGDSACGSLKMAQHYGEGEYQSGSIGVSISHTDRTRPTQEELDAALHEAEEKMHLAWKNAIPLGGNPADVFGFSLAFSIGDISENQPGPKRLQVLDLLFSVYPDAEAERVAPTLQEQANKALHSIRERCEAGEALRIWYSNQPDEICGMHWFMEQIAQWSAYDMQVFILKLPEWETDENRTVIQRSGWGEVAPGEWHRYIGQHKPVPLSFIQGCASHWIKLQEENAPLRAVVNGQLVSVPKTFYDAFILREIAAEGDEFQEAMVIGRVLGKYHLGIGDAWVALRIEEMVQAGMLEAVSTAADCNPSYHRVLRKRDFKASI